MRHRPARALLPPLLLLAAACADPAAPERRPLAVRRTAALDAPGAEPQTVVLYANGDLDAYRDGRLFVRTRGELATITLGGKSRTVNLREIAAQQARQRAALTRVGAADPPMHYFAGDRPPGAGGGGGCFDEGIKLGMTSTAAAAAFWALDAAIASTGVGAPVAFAMGIALIAYTGAAVNFVNCMNAQPAGGS